MKRMQGFGITLSIFLAITLMPLAATARVTDPLVAFVNLSSDQQASVTVIMRNAQGQAVGTAQVFSIGPQAQGYSYHSDWESFLEAGKVYSVTVSADQPIAVVFNQTASDGGSCFFNAPDQPASVLYYPMLNPQPGTELNTKFQVYNPNDDNNWVKAVLHNADGSQAETVERDIAPWATEEFDALMEAASSFDGSATMTAEQPVIGLGKATGDDDWLIVGQPGPPASEDGISKVIMSPLGCDGPWGQSSYYALQNASDAAGDIYQNAYDPSGDYFYEGMASVPGRGLLSKAVCDSTVLSRGTNYSLKASNTSGVPFVGARADQWSGGGMTVTRGAVEAQKELLFPYVINKHNGMSSKITVFNTAYDTQTLTIQYTDSTGKPWRRVSHDVPPFGSLTEETNTVLGDDDFQGSVRVSGSGTLAGQTAIVSDTEPGRAFGFMTGWPINDDLKSWASPLTFNPPGN